MRFEERAKLILTSIQGEGFLMWIGIEDYRKLIQLIDTQLTFWDLHDRKKFDGDDKP